MVACRPKKNFFFFFFRCQMPRRSRGRRFVAGTVATGAAAALPAEAQANAGGAVVNTAMQAAPGERADVDDRRRGDRGADRGARAAARPATRLIVLEARDPGRRPHVELRHRPPATGRARRTFVGPTQDYVLALCASSRSRSSPLRRRRRPLLAGSTRLTYSDTANGHRAARPGDPCRAGDRRPGARPDVDVGSGRRPWSAAERGRVGRQTLQAGSRRTRSPPTSASSCRDRHTPDLRRRAARAVTAVRAVLHRRLGDENNAGRSSATSTPATAPRCGASTAARRRSL